MTNDPGPPLRKRAILYHSSKERLPPFLGQQLLILPVTVVTAAKRVHILRCEMCSGRDGLLGAVE